MCSHVIDLAHDAPARLRADVAVVGAGVAGVTIARRLLKHGLSVILLESGGVDYEADIADLNRGKIIGRPYYDLAHARLRFFGGTTAIWGGRCAELDPIDFETRDWVPYSGWPISYETVIPYYYEARMALGLPCRAPLRAGHAFDLDELVQPAWWFDDRFDRFTLGACADLVADPRCKIVIHATVNQLVPEASGRRIEALEAVHPGGRAMRIEARHFVLAAGGIENPRLLLASRSVHPAGIGNENGLVGRFFMEHPHARGGRIVAAAPWRLLAASAMRRNGAHGYQAQVIAAAPELQRRERLLNSSLTIAARKPAGGKATLLKRAYLRTKEKTPPTFVGRTLWRATKGAARALRRASDPLLPWTFHRLGRVELALVIRAEQAPNPDSRVRLTDERDALGMPRIALDWRLSALDKHSVNGLVAATGRELVRLGLGQVDPAPWLTDPDCEWHADPLISAHPIGGYHHLGTTRMADDPRRGVTNSDGRVHGIANLYVAGSSIFPTGGWANPTLTIMALALRTADRLAAPR